jgi:hypothetical protein
MATSGTTTFELDVSDVIEEAYERLGIELRTGYQAKTARRSLNLLLQHLSNKQINLWKLGLNIVSLTQGTAIYILPSYVTDVKNVVLRRGTTDTTMNRLSRQEYQTRPNKAAQGRPSQYFIERLITLNMHIYLTPENSTDSIRYYGMNRIQDITGSQNTIDIPSRFAPAIISGLTYQLAIKVKPELIEIMKSIYDEELNVALDEDRERVPFKVVPKIARV